MITFKVGDKVEALEDFDGLKKGKTYTVYRVNDEEGLLCVTCAELDYRYYLPRAFMKYSEDVPMLQFARMVTVDRDG